jgi:hypothetical protein
MSEQTTDREEVMPHSAPSPQHYNATPPVKAGGNQGAAFPRLKNPKSRRHYEAVRLADKIYHTAYEDGYEAGKAGKRYPVWCVNCGFPVPPLRVSRHMKTWGFIYLTPSRENPIFARGS